MNGHRSIIGARLHSLLECMVYSWVWEGNYKTHDQSIHERVTASYYMLGHISPCISGNMECLKSATHFPIEFKHTILTNEACKFSVSTTKLTQILSLTYINEKRLLSEV